MSDLRAQPHTDADTYQVTVKGHLDARWSAQLNVPSLTHETDGTTILGGIAADQATLHGLLQRIRDLGLTLVSVIRIGRPIRLSQDPSSNPRRPS